VAIRVTPQQRDSMAEHVYQTARSWLEVNYGERCDEYELGCESCLRYELLDKLLAGTTTVATLIKEVERLDTALAWRWAMLERMEDTKQPEADRTRVLRLLEQVFGVAEQAVKQLDDSLESAAIKKELEKVTAAREVLCQDRVCPPK